MDNITYYSTVKLLHIIGMSAWFGTAIVVSIIWSKKDGIDLNLILDLITKVENKKIISFILGGPNKYYNFSEKEVDIIFNKV